jgi:hypothetical protein
VPRSMDGFVVHPSRHSPTARSSGRTMEKISISISFLCWTRSS